MDCAPSQEVLLPALIVTLIVITFTTASWARVSTELRSARRELGAEYRDKKMMARYARVEI